jgi:hypothetical protein
LALAKVLAKGKGDCEYSTEPASRKGAGFVFALISTEIGRTIMAQQTRPEQPQCMQGHKAGTSQARKRDSYFNELLDLAADGDEAAVHDLWLTYGYDYAREGRGND